MSKFDETIPGGIFGNEDGSGFHDAWGKPVVVESTEKKEGTPSIPGTSDNPEDKPKVETEDDSKPTIKTKSSVKASLKTKTEGE